MITRWIPTPRAFALGVALAVSAPLVGGCAVDQADLDRWQTTVNGPTRLRAVVMHKKYRHDLRVSAAHAMIAMKPRKGQRVGIKMLVEESLAQLDDETRAVLVRDIVPLIIKELDKKPPAVQAGQAAPPDPSIKYKDVAYLMLTFKQKPIIADTVLQKQLKEALTRWAMADFERRLLDRSQAYGMEQLLQYIGAPSVAGLPALMTKDARQLQKMAALIAKIGDDKTKDAAAAKLVGIAKHTASDQWRKEHTEELREANRKGKHDPTKEQFEKQLKEYQDESVIRIFGSLKKVGRKPIVDYCLDIAKGAKEPEKRRKVALAAIEGHIDAKDKKQIDTLLAIAKSDAPPTVLDQAFRRLQSLPRDKVAGGLYGIFKSEKWLIRRAAGGALLAMSKAKHIDEFFDKLDSLAKKNFNLPEAITYGARISAIKDGDPKKAVEKRLARGGVRSRLSALGYYFEKGGKEDIGRLEKLTKDRQRVPKCDDDGDCDWTCLVGAGKEQQKKDVKTVGDYVNFCILPKVRQNSTSASKDKPKKGDKKENKGGAK